MRTSICWYIEEQNAVWHIDSYPFVSQGKVMVQLRVNNFDIQEDGSLSSYMCDWPSIIIYLCMINIITYGSL